MILITWLKVHNTEQDFLMFKYMINIIWYGYFRITSRINPRAISSLELKLSGWYWCLGLIRDVIRKEPYNILYILKLWSISACIGNVSRFWLYCLVNLVSCFPDRNLGTSWALFDLSPCNRHQYQAFQILIYKDLIYCV
jgi:hypothetical protein